METRLLARPGLMLIGAIVLVTVVMTWPYFSYQHVGSASYGGDTKLIIWTLAWDNHAVLTGAPLFDANIFFPAAHSLQYNEHLFGVSLFTLPWAVAGASPVLAYNVTWWLAWVLNGIMTVALLRRFVGSRLPAFVGSLAFTCSFYVMLHAHGHLHLIWLWPIPLSLLLLERWFDEPRVGRLAAWMAIVLLEILASWYMAVIIILANAAMALVLLMTVDAGTPGASLAGLWRRRVLHMACAVIVVTACVYPFARHYVGLTAAAGEAASLSADLASYLVPPGNTIVGRWWLAHIGHQPRSIWGEQTLFAGWIALALAAIGCVTLARGRHVSRRASVFPLLAVMGFLLSLGPNAPLLGGAALAPFHWLSALPAFRGMRAAARFAQLCSLGVSGLAAIGVTAIVRVFRRTGRIAAAVLVPLMLAEWFVVDFPAGPPPPEQIPAIYRTPAVRSARALVSLPEYRDTPEWPRGGDYLYYSTAHWRPIVNGFGRSEPPNQDAVMAIITAFPDSAEAIARLGVQFVVVHADRFPNHGEEIVARARASPECRLVEQIGSDYLFEMVRR